jgi:zinc/manganese transport system substrate-binding protein
VTALVTEAKAAGIPVVTMTETIEPPGASFVAWQVAELKALQAALRQSTGR